MLQVFCSDYKTKKLFATIPNARQQFFVYLNIKNKHYISVLIFLFTVSALAFVISLLMPDNLLWAELTTEGFSLTSIVGFVFLMRNGTFHKTVYFKIALALSFVITIGAMFKIMHWPGSNIMLTLGFSGMIVNYGIRYIKKPTKVRLDYLKLLWVSTSYLISLGIIMRWGFRDFAFVPHVILFITVAYFAYSNRNNIAVLNY